MNVIHPMRRLMMLCEASPTFHDSRTVSGSPYSRHVTVHVNPTPEIMLQILIQQQNKISQYNDNASIRVVSAKNGIKVSSMHTVQHVLLDVSKRIISKSWKSPEQVLNDLKGAYQTSGAYPPD